MKYFFILKTMFELLKPVATANFPSNFWNGRRVAILIIRADISRRSELLLN